MRNLTKLSCLPLLLATLAAPLAAQDATPVENHIDAVTVYGGSARVTRVSAPVRSDGLYVFEGLAADLDPANVRVRMSAGHVLGVEVKGRWVLHTPEQRVQALRDQLRTLQREQIARRDEFALLEELRVHVERQLGPETGAEGQEKLMPNLVAWQTSHDYYSEELRELLRERRELRWQGEAAEVELQNLRDELGGLGAGSRVHVYDVFVDVDLGQGPSTLALEYFVTGCGWTPTYDLRASGDARSVELVYRAEVVQQTAEDWRGVELALSTARPRRGAAGPDPAPRWVDLGQPSQGLYAEASRRQDRDDRAMALSESAGFAFSGPFAATQSAGLSVRFVLPGRETLDSRPQPTTVLVGEATLAVEPELYCAPALDETVWLRGRARNSSPYVLLPGNAAIFFGDDFIGNATLDEVQPGQELELALGAVPGITSERVLVGEEHDAPGFFSSTAKELSRYRVRLSNHGSPVSQPGGGALVVVREAIPRSRDERLEVELTESSQPVSNLPRWRADREDRSILTWTVSVPAGGDADLTWELTLSHPSSKDVVLE